MSHHEDSGRRFVTNSELDKKLDDKPSRWEVRFLIVAAVFVAPSIPSIQGVAHAAIQAIG